MSSNRATTVSAGAVGPAQQPVAGGGVSIRSLNLRIPGANALAGRRIAERVSAELARRLGPDFAGHVQRLDVRVPSSGARSEWAMTSAIADAVVRALEGRR